MYLGCKITARKGWWIAGKAMVDGTWPMNVLHIISSFDHWQISSQIIFTSVQIIICLSVTARWITEALFTILQWKLFQESPCNQFKWDKYVCHLSNVITHKGLAEDKWTIIVKVNGSFYIKIHKTFISCLFQTGEQVIYIDTIPLTLFTIVCLYNPIYWSMQLSIQRENWLPIAHTISLFCLRAKPK